jgi:hypothetical protein
VAIAPKNVTAVGAVVAAGIGTTVVMSFVRVGSEQVVATVQVAVVLVMSEASRGNGVEVVVLVNCVEVMERCHPSAEPDRSLLVNGIVYVAILPGVPVKLYDAAEVSLYAPPVTDPFTGGESAKAGVVTPGNRSPPPIIITSSNAP